MYGNANALQGPELGSAQFYCSRSFKCCVLQLRGEWRLVIPKLETRLTGNYTCILSNRYSFTLAWVHLYTCPPGRWGEVRHTVRVEGLQHAVYAPKLLERPANVTIVAGEPPATGARQLSRCL